MNAVNYYAVEYNLKINLFRNIKFESKVKSALVIIVDCSKTIKNVFRYSYKAQMKQNLYIYIYIYIYIYPL